MLKNYLKIAVRNLAKNKIYALIHIVGLAIGMSCMLLAYLFVRDEYDFDTFHENNPNLYRVTTAITEQPGAERQLTGGTGMVQAVAFKQQIAEITAITRVMGGSIYSDVHAGSKAIRLRPLFVDSTFFDVFSFPMLRGTHAHSLSTINSVVITEKTALRFFNSIDVLGKLLELDADPSAQTLGKPLIISGVVKDPPENSSLQFEMLLPFRFMQLAFNDPNWLNSYLGTFMVLNPKANTANVINTMNKIYRVYAKDQLAESLKNKFNPDITYGLQSIQDIHLNPLQLNGESGVVNTSSPLYSYLFIGIAAFILIMASINFINISLANSFSRFKEVGIRKATGSTRQQIIFQFLSESGIICLMAFLLAIAIVSVCLPVFNVLSGKAIQFIEVLSVRSILCFGALLLINILMAALYPSVVMSALRPVDALYKKPKLLNNGLFGNGLIVFQFSLSIIMIIATMIFYSQMDFIRNKDLGYMPAQVLRSEIPGNRDLPKISAQLRNEVLNVPFIENISFGAEAGTYDTKVGNRTIKTTYRNGDYNHIPTLGIQVKLGRNFSPDFSGDKQRGLIVNEAFVRAYGLKKPLGVQVTIAPYFENSKREIIGVIKDFHSGSLKERIQPMIMFMYEPFAGGIWLKLNRKNQVLALQAWEKIFKKVMPGAVYRYSFLDELNHQQYYQEERWQKIIGYATGISFFICCLGLFGIAKLSAHRRTKEIGIRKVLGASVASIVALLSTRFLKLVLMAIVMAVPVGWYISHLWLQNFVYKIEMEWWIFLTAGVVSLLVAFLTVSLESIKAALLNPVKSLRME
ncbi:ABC transporter permease [Emticicia agri]|uniref:FtsX-like permease family protein n=1 Tax=Emticicia agri TaxID=2492393 RepID=A0A4Q5M385_9BACT|nr:ABC transporter permease [Emticicia agri]RYU96343.1 FtsX-like permease family protein [Emticicia agri]